MAKKIMLLVWLAIANMSMVCICHAEDVQAISNMAYVEQWGTISGSALSMLTGDSRYPGNPDKAFFVNAIDLTPNADYYGIKIRACFVPLETGDYTFWVAGDNCLEFWLSSDETADNIQKEAYLDRYTSRNQWTKYVSQKSREIRLEAGKKYFFQVLHKENTGGDFLQAAWSLNGGEKHIISGENLTSFAQGDTQPPQTPGKPVVSKLKNNTVKVSWAAGVHNSCVYEYRIYKNGEYTASSRGPVYIAACPEDELLSNSYQVSAVDLSGKESALSVSSSFYQGDAEANGLIGTYYKDSHFVNAVLERVDETVNFLWGAESPASCMQADCFSVAWEGQIVPSYSEEYKITVSADDRASLWVNGVLVYDKWDTTAETVQTIQLEAGHKYDIRLLYYENKGNAKCRMIWQSPSQKHGIVPTECLFAKRLAGCPDISNIWVGLSGDNLWSNRFNWSLGNVPTQDSDVIYIAEFNNECFINTDIDIKSLLLEKSYLSDIYCENQNLSIRQDINTGYSCPTFSPEACLLLNGTEDQEILLYANIRFKDIVVNNSSGTVKFYRNIKSENLTINAGATVRCSSGISLYTDNLYFNGTAEKRIGIGLIAQGDPWYLRLTPGGEQNISCVDVASSNAKYSDPIDGTDRCHDCGKNTNWVFDFASAIEIQDTEVEGALLVEGYTMGEDLENVSIYVNGVEIPVQVAGNKLWFADVQLVEGHENKVEVIKNGQTIYLKEIAYTKNDITGKEIVVRNRDGYLLKADKGIRIDSTIKLDFDNDGAYETAAFENGRFTHIFAEPGIYNVAAQIDRNNDGLFEGENELNQTLTVKAISVDFNGPIACEMGYERQKNDIVVKGAKLDEVIFTSTNNVGCIVDKYGDNGENPFLTIYPIALDSPSILARYGSKNGPIIEQIPLNVFKFLPTTNNSMNIVKQFANSDVLVSGCMYMYPLVKDLNVELHIFVWGATFEDSTIDQTISTNDFTRNSYEKMPFGSYGHSIKMIMTKERLFNHGPCHRIKIYQNGVQVGD